ncbi:MAG: ketoacyl-ACP synthase III [Saprospiraceae bacterium]|nr:ketoacyl-ACP synthase III [Saprospiraceae bacterium]
MEESIYSVITGTGSYIPKRRVPNSTFLAHTFLDRDGQVLPKSNKEIVEKFLAITTIAERRYAEDDMRASDLAFYAAEKAISHAAIDPETLDYVIVAHNFGDVGPIHKRVDLVPTLAARVKQKLAIKNPYAIAYDLPFGCPGWVQAVIQADYYIKSGDAQRILVIGSETLSRISDPHDRDSMLYADGAGAVVLEARHQSQPVGVLAHRTRSDTLRYANMLYMDESYNRDNTDRTLFLKMHGRKLYQYALEHVPSAIKSCLDKSGHSLEEVKKILIHQANGKMDEAILKRLFGLYDILDIPSDIMPMTVSYLGNSSVATVPTLLDLIIQGQLEPHHISSGDIVVFASVGAGMNINAVVYRVP